MNNDTSPNLDNDSLETPDSSLETTVVGSEQPEQSHPVNTPNDYGVVSPDAPRQTQVTAKEPFVKRALNKLNIYVVLLMVVLLVLAGASLFAIQQNKKSAQKDSLNTQELTQEALNKLAGTSPTIGDVSQTLNIASNAIFGGGVLVKGGLDIAGTLKIGGALSLPNITIGNTATVDLLAAKRLTVAGDAAIQGKVTIQNGMSVVGAGTFSGPLSATQISTDKLQLTGDLQLSQHIDPNGSTPGRTNGGALGSGGTASNNGNDTAGTITINTGSNAPAGCFITINFAKSFTNIPHVVISPASSSAATIDYYVNRNASGFSVCDATDAPDNTAGISFDYIVLD